MRIQACYTILIFFLLKSSIVCGLNESPFKVLNVPIGSHTYSHNCDNSEQRLEVYSNCFTEKQQTSTWYSFHTPMHKTTIDLSFYNESLGENAAIAIYDNSRFMQIWQKCLDPGKEKTESTFVNLETDYTYFFQVSSTYESQGDFSFNFAFANGTPPLNDDCEGAQEMFGDGVLDCYENDQVFGDFTCATEDPEATGNCVDPTDIGVWYTFSTPDPLPYNTMWQGLSPTAFEIFSTTSDCSGLQYVTCSTGTLMFYPDPGTTYYILSAGVSVSWMIQDPPFIINCEEPLSHLNGGPGVNTAISTTQCGDPSTLFPCEGDHTTWYEYTTGCNTGTITIEVEEYTTALGDGPAAEIAIVAVFDDCTTILSAYDPDGNGYVCSAMSGNEILTLENIPPNSNLVFGFGSAGNNTGNLEITVTETITGSSPNDVCSDALILGQGQNTDLSNYCSTMDISIPSCGPQSEATVWYEYDAGNDPVDITLQLSPTVILNPAMAAYADCSGDFLGSVCGTFLKLDCITGIIKIQIGSELSDEGEFDLDISSTPSLVPPVPEYTAPDICSGTLSDITIFFPGGESGDFEISESSSSSPNIQGIQNYSLSDASFIVINDLLTNTSSNSETAVYLVETSFTGYTCPTQNIEISFLVYPQFTADPPHLEDCLPFMISLFATDIVDGGVQAYQSFNWLWNGTDNIGSDNHLSFETTEAGTITLEVEDAEGCLFTTDIDVNGLTIEEPSFNFATTYCPADDDFITFPEESNEGIEGIWDPESIDLDDYSGSFLTILFTPDEEYCADPLTLQIEVEEEEFPDFDLPETLCTNLGIYIFPEEDLNEIPGEWEFQSIDLSTTLGQVSNIFYPSSNVCIDIFEYSFEVVSSIEITFDIPDNICLMDTNIILNPVSLEGYNGEWIVPGFNPIHLADNTFENTWIADEATHEFCVSDEEIIIEIIEPGLPQFDLPSFMCNSDTVFYFPPTDNLLTPGSWSIDSIDPGFSMDSIVSVFIADAGFCVDTFEWVVNIFPSDNPQFSFDITLCALDDQFTLPAVSDNGITGTWNSPDVDPATLSGQTIDISFQPDSLFACANVYLNQLTIDNPDLAVFNLPEVFCWTDNDFILPTISDNSIQGNWTVPEVNIQANIGQLINTTFIPLGGQCAVDYDAEFIILSPYDVELQENIPDDCVSTNGNIQILGNTSDLEFSIDGGLTWQSETLFDALGSGTYEILIRSEIHMPCVHSIEANLNIVDAPQIDNILESDLSGCFLVDGEIIVEATGNNLEYSLDGISWQSENCFKDLQAGYYEIYIRDVDAIDCVVEGSTTIEEFPQTVILATNSTDISDCQVDDGQIEIFADGLNLEYSIDGGITWSPQNTFKDLPFGEYTIVVRSADAPDCEDSAVLTLIAPRDPEIIDIHLSNPSNCELTTGGIEILANGINIEYSIDGGLTWHNDFVFLNLSEGTYDISIREKNNINCISTETVTLVNSIQTLAEISLVTLPVSECMAQDGVITIYIDETDVEYSIDGGNTWQPESVFSGLPSGTFHIIVRRQGNDACTSSIEATIDNEDCPCNVLEVELETVIPDCMSSELASASILSVEGTTDPDYQIMWNNGQTSATISNLTGGIYTLTIQYDNNCMWMETFAIELPHPLNFDISIQNSDCPSAENASIEIINVSGGSGNYSFTIDGIQFQPEAAFYNLSVGTYDVTVQDSEGCISMQHIQVQSDNNFQIELPPLITINQGESVSLSPSIQESLIDSFLWTINNVQLVGASYILEHTPTETSTYSLTVYYGSCSEDVSTFVELHTIDEEPVTDEDLFYLSNIFMPGTNGPNNRFFVQSKPDTDLRISGFHIYDRWGNLVFTISDPEPNSPGDGWDGSYNNYEVGSGVFVYVIFYTLHGQEKVLGGNMTLLR